MLLVLLGLWVTMQDRRHARIPRSGLGLAAGVMVAYQIVAGYLVTALIGGGIMIFIAMPLAAWTTIGGGHLQYGILLGLALGPVEASLVWLLATLAALMWGALQAIGQPAACRSSRFLGPWLAAASVAVAIYARWPGHSP